MEFVDRGRVDEPRWLVDNAEQWGREWAEKLEVDRQSRWIWRQCDGHGHDDLVERLGVMTDRHCSYCDAFPMGPRVQQTIDHFRPKVSFPNDAYRWENLFLSCSLCQKKKFDEQLLKPDVRPTTSTRTSRSTTRPGKSSLVEESRRLPTCRPRSR